MSTEEKYIAASQELHLAMHDANMSWDECHRHSAEFESQIYGPGFG